MHLHSFIHHRGDTHIDANYLYHCIFYQPYTPPPMVPKTVSSNRTLTSDYVQNQALAYFISRAEVEKNPVPDYLNSQIITDIDQENAAVDRPYF